MEEKQNNLLITIADAFDRGIINTEDLYKTVDSMKRKEILKQHGQSKWQYRDGRYWYVNIPDTNSKRGRRQVRRNSEEAIDEVIYEAYSGIQKQNATFREAWNLWRKVQDLDVSDNTICRYKDDWKRFFQGTDFSRMDIHGIHEKEVRIFLISRTKELVLCRKAVKTMFSYISRVIFNARKEGIIEEDPTEFLKAKDFYHHCTESETDPRERIVSPEEMNLLFSQIYQDYLKKPRYITPYAVEFASYTGMRVGEVAGLKWTDIHDGRIRICRFERFNEARKVYEIVEHTKNWLIREMPITAEMKDVLERVKAAEMKYGFESEWVFSDATGRIHTNLINSCLKNKCKQVGINAKGVHAFRRTLNSEMKSIGASTATAAALLGHTEDVNDRYYTYDVATENERRALLEAATGRLHNGGNLSELTSLTN